MPLKIAIDAAVEASGTNLQRNGHSLSTDIPEEPLFIDADHTRIALKVVSNLLDNASKYTPNRGKIDLSVRREARRRRDLGPRQWARHPQ